MRWRRCEGLMPYDVDETGETVVLDPATQAVVALNPSAAAVWYLCDGTRDETAVAALVCETLPGLDAERVQADIATAVRDLAGRGLIEPVE